MNTTRHSRMIAHVIGLIIWGPIGSLWAEQAPSSIEKLAPAVTKVLHFPKDQCLGVLHVEDRSRGSEYVQHHFDPSLPWGLDPQLLDLHTAWQSVGTARGDVTAPADRDIALRVMLKPKPSELVHPNLRDRRFTDPEDLSALSGLEPTDLGMLFVYSLGERTYADERVVKPLSRLTGLKMLRLCRTGVTDKGMEYLRSLHSLRSLELTEARVSDAGLAVLKDLPTLEYLDFYTATGDAGLKYLGQSSNLRWVRIRMGRIGGPGLAELASLPRLERLCLWGDSGLTDRHLKYLEGLTHLKSLTLWGTDDPPLTDASLASIGKLTRLEELYFIRIATTFTSAGVARLKGLKNLKKVELGPSGLDEAGMRHLAALPNLVAVNGNVPLTGTTAKTIGSLRNLQSLDIGLENRTAPGAVPSLFALTSLEELRFVGARVGASLSDENLAGLESLSHLKSLLIGSQDVTDRSMMSIGKLERLESLDLWANVTRRGLNQLSGLTHLRTLAVSPLPDPSGGVDEVPLKLSALTDLRTLCLHNLSLHDEDLASLADMRHLEWLVLDGSFTEDGLRYLGDLPELKLLDVTGVTCSNGEGLARLGGLKKLEDLTLRGRITDAALAQLAVLPSLWSLRIVTDESIRPETVAHLKQTLPVIEYIHIDKLTLGDPPRIQSSPGQPRRAPPDRPRANPPLRRTPPRQR
jgi:internalin A